MANNNRSRPQPKRVVSPTIVCCNHTTVLKGLEFQNLLAALQVYVSDHVLPVWGTDATLVGAKNLRADSWGMVFLDNADQLGASGFHELTHVGLPLAKVFVKTALEEGQPASVAASHELVEMLVDPSNSISTAGPEPGMLYSYECADPVEEYTFSINGFEVTDFVYPEYFEAFRKPGSAQFDHMKRVRRPFQILPGGYQSFTKNGVQSNLFGSAAKQRSFKHEDRRGHRVEARRIASRAKSDPKVIKKHFG